LNTRHWDAVLQMYLDAILSILRISGPGLSGNIKMIPLLDRQYQRDSRFVASSCKRMEALNTPVDVHGCIVGLVEARGDTGLVHGSTCTDWKS